MDLKQKAQLALRALVSICASAFLSFLGLAFMFVRTLGLHRNSSAPGDFAQTEARPILADIFISRGISLPLTGLVLCILE